MPDDEVGDQSFGGEYFFGVGEVCPARSKAGMGCGSVSWVVGGVVRFDCVLGGD